MKTYVIKRKEENFDWDNIPGIELEFMNWTEWVDILTEVRICYDDEALYLRYKAKEEDVRAEFTGPLGTPCLDSCFEFFYSPCDDDRYMNIEINPNTCMHIGFGAPGPDRVRIIVKNIARFSPQVTYLNDGWTLTYKVPFEFIRIFFPSFSVEAGKEFRANFYKCGDKTPHPHYIVWNPINTPTPNFHRPTDFGVLIFE